MDLPEGMGRRVKRQKRQATELCDPTDLAVIAPKRTRSKVRQRRREAPLAVSQSSAPQPDLPLLTSTPANLSIRPVLVRQATPAEEAELAFLQGLDQLELLRQTEDERSAERLCDEAADWDQHAELEQFKRTALQV